MTVTTLDPAAGSKFSKGRTAAKRRMHARGGFREFVIIVLGVVTALTAEAIRQSVVDRSTEREYTARLLDELAHGRETIVYNVSRLRTSSLAIDTLLGMPDRTRDTGAVVRLSLRA